MHGLVLYSMEFAILFFDVMIVTMRRNLGSDPGRFRGDPKHVNA